MSCRHWVAGLALALAFAAACLVGASVGGAAPYPPTLPCTGHAVPAPGPSCGGAQPTFGLGSNPPVEVQAPGSGESGSGGPGSATPGPGGSSGTAQPSGVASGSPSGSAATPTTGAAPSGSGAPGTPAPSSTVASRIAPPRASPGEPTAEHTNLILTLIAIGTLGCVLVLVGLSRRHEH